MDLPAVIFSLKKIIPLFLLPPGIFILALLALGWHLWRAKKKGSAFCVYLLSLLLWLLSTGFMADKLMGRLEEEFTVPKKPAGDVIVLLGGGINENAPDLTGSGAPLEAMLARMVTAVRLQRQLHLPILISGGGKPGRIPETRIVRRFLLDLGVADRDILLEDKSRDTTQNARFSKEILKRHNFRHPLLVTSAFHMRRSVEAFKRFDVAVTPVPASFISSPESSAEIWSVFMPQADALCTSTTLLSAGWELMLTSLKQIKYSGWLGRSSGYLL